MSARHKAKRPATAPDRGASGPAMQARAIRERETLEDGKRAVVAEMLDADPLNAMSLTRLQQDVAAYLRDLWQDCLPGLDMPGSYGCGAGHGGRRHLTADEEAAAKRAWWDYRQAMDYLSHNVGRAYEQAVSAAVVRGEPARPGAVREGLDALARHWKMR